MDSRYIAIVASFLIVSCYGDPRQESESQAVETESIAWISTEDSPRGTRNSNSFEPKISFSEENPKPTDIPDGFFKDIEAISTVDLSREHYLFQAALAKMF